MLYTKGGNLFAGNASVVSDELRQRLLANKPALIEFLTPKPLESEAPPVVAEPAVEVKKWEAQEILEQLTGMTKQAFLHFNVLGIGQNDDGYFLELEPKKGTGYLCDDDVHKKLAHAIKDITGLEARVRVRRASPEVEPVVEPVGTIVPKVETVEPVEESTAVEIDALNEQANIYANQALIYAAKCGQKLLLAKAQCNHGDFKTWLNENCKLSYTTAKKYMQLVAARPDLLDSNRPLTGVLPSITQMIELLSADESVNEEVTAKIEAGEDVTIKEIQRLKKEAAETQAKLDGVQNDLITKTQRLDEAVAKVQFQALTVESVTKQNDELRNRDQALIDAKVAEEKAKLLFENSAAIQSKQKEVDDANDALTKLNEMKTLEINKLKSEQDKAIADGVRSKLNELDNEIRRKELSINGLTERIELLYQTKSTLDKDVGELQKHNKAIEKIKDLLGSLSGCMFDLIDDENATPVEVMNDWVAIGNALDKLKSDVGSIIEMGGNVVISGELVD